MPRFPALLNFLLLMASLVACDPQDTPRNTPPAEGGAAARSLPIPLADTEWVLLSLDGTSPVAGTRITLEFTPERHLGGYAGCNWYGSEYTQDGDALGVAEIERTARACHEPPGVLEQENRYLRMLEASSAYQVAGDTLRTEAAEGAGVLVFQRRKPLPMNPADLVGTQWRLDIHTDTSPAIDPPITLRFGKQDVSGFAGCRDYSGLYKADGDEIRFPQLAMAETDCSDPKRLEREGEYTTRLSEAAHYRLGADRLELYTAGGDTLTFRSQP